MCLKLVRMFYNTEFLSGLWIKRLIFACKITPDTFFGVGRGLMFTQTCFQHQNKTSETDFPSDRPL
jgi:hypothetical protein